MAIAYHHGATHGRCYLALVAFLAAMGVAIAGARAGELVVVASSAAELPAGTRLEEGARLQLPAGTSVTILADSGRSWVIEGPFEGAVPQAEGAQAGQTSVIALLSDLLASGGGRDIEIGAVRGKGATGMPPQPAWIDVTRSATYCVVAAEGGAILWRPSAERTARVRLTRIDTASSVTVEWPAGASTRPWPEALPPADGAAYLAVADRGSAPARLELRLVPAALGGGYEAIAWMAAHGCRAQGRAAALARVARIAPLDIALTSDRGRTPRYRIGEAIAFVVRTNRRAALYCVHSDAAGATLVLFPGPDPGGPWIEADAPLALPGPRLEVRLAASMPTGRERLACFAVADDPAQALPASLTAGDFSPVSAADLERVERVLGGYPASEVARDSIEIVIE
jgi:hypothetical protein